MPLASISPAEFQIRCVIEVGPGGYISHDTLHLGIAAALGLGSEVTPRHTSVGARMAHAPRPGERLECFARIRGVRGVNSDGHKVAMVAYSFFYRDRHGSYALWSLDLDDDTSVPGHDRPNELWFRRGDEPVLLTDELRAKIKALAPKLPRAAASRAAR